MTDLGERDLIRRTIAGDTEAYGKLVQTHQGRVRAYIGGYIPEPDVVDDLAQDVFLTAYADIATFREESAFSTWLLGIARHRVLRCLRSGLRRGRIVDQLLDGGAAIRLAEEERGLLERERAMVALERCLERLPPGSSKLIDAHYFRSSSVADIARRASKGESALRMALLRIRRALRECMERQISPEIS